MARTHYNNWFFTADEHYGHARIIRPDYCNRPFENIQEMDAEIIRRHNSVVSSNDVVVHAGDFTLTKGSVAYDYVSKLNGNHVFLRGSHDYWLDKKSHEIFERRINGQYIVACHYAMRTWPRSHYGSWQVYGHSHGHLEPIGKQHDVGVDNNNFYPVSFEQLVEIMSTRDSNPGRTELSRTRLNREDIHENQIDY